MSRWPGRGAAVLLPLGFAGLSMMTATAGASPAQTPTGDLKRVVLDINKPRVLDLNKRIVALDNSISDVTKGNEVTVTLNADVFFAFDKADLAPPAAGALGQLAPQLARDAKGTVRIDGYTDAKGADTYNQDLSQRRAAAVEAELKRLAGSASPTFSSNGHGAADPVAPNTKPDGSDDPDGRARNRRVTVTYTR
jgi:outer membrane protein OmpA-like peptidoglycan-associated protein